MSQTENNKPTAQDIIALEVMGMLVGCFHDTIEVKNMLYEGLHRATILNTKIVNHISDFLMPQFGYFFNFVGSHFEIHFEHIFEEGSDEDDGDVDQNEEDGEASDEIIVRDHIGKFTQLVVHCIVTSDQHDMQFSYESVRAFFDKALDKCAEMPLSVIGVDAPITEKKMILAIQFLNLLEVFMTYAIWKATDENEFVKKLINMYQHWSDCQDELNALRNPKGTKKKKENWHAKYRKHQPLWDLATLLRFMQAFFNQTFEGLNEINRNYLKSETGLKTYMMTVTSEAIKNICNEPQYLQTRQSKRGLTMLINLAKIMFKEMQVRVDGHNPELGSNETLGILEIFKNTIDAVECLFKRRCDDFYRKILESPSTEAGENIDTILVVVKSMITKLGESGDAFEDLSVSSKILTVLLSIVETLQERFSINAPQLKELYEFIYNVCLNYELDSKPLGNIFKVLFLLREKVTAGSDFYETIGILLAREYGTINDEKAMCPFIFKSITDLTVEPCAIHLLNTVKTHMTHVMYLLRKSDALYTLDTQFPCRSSSAPTQIKQIDGMAITLMICVAKILSSSSNTAMGLTAPMMKMIQLIKNFYCMLLKITQKLNNMWNNDNQLDFEELK